MSAPPPPPPPPIGGPPPPPPPSFGGLGKGPSKGSSGGSNNRSALLADIRGGARLKKAKTNDRSSPIVNNKPSAGSSAPSGPSGGSSSGGGNSGGAFSASGASPSPLGLGGLFANGMPKLKATGSRLIPEKTISNTNSRSTTSPVKSTGPAVAASKPNIAPNKFTPKPTPSPAAATQTGPTRQQFSSKLNTLNSNSSRTTVASSNSGGGGSSLHPNSGGGGTLASRKSSSPEIESARKKLAETLAFQSNTASTPPSTKSNDSPALTSHLPASHTSSSSLHRSHHNLNSTSSSPAIASKPVPPQKYHTISPKKHNYSAVNSNDLSMPAHKGQAPLPPTGGQNRSALHRSNSQSNSRANAVQPRPSPKPPNVKPPPPPKQSMVDSSASNGPNRAVAPPPPPPPPSAVTASNSVKNISAMMINANLNPMAPGGNKSSLHGAMQQQSQSSSPIKPPAPPRNSSYPNSLSSANGNETAAAAPMRAAPTLNPHSNALRPSGLGHNHSSSSTSLSSTTSQQSNKAIRPPPGPPPPPPNRVSSVANPTMNRSQKPAPPIPMHIAPDGNMAIVSSMPLDNSLPPPPPVRHASITKEPFVNRFRFRDICELPAPCQVSNLTKVYPSQLHRNRRREPPPPPPPGPPMTSPVGNGQFANNFPDKRFHIQIQRTNPNY